MDSDQVAPSGCPFPSVRVHATAIIENGVSIGPGTSIWDNVHIRGADTTIGSNCIVGEKTHIAYGVRIGNLVKINAFAYICTGVTIEDGVMISAGVVFTNDRFPRAANPELSELLSSAVGESTLFTVVREGATLGARSVIGSDLEIGRFAMVGMGSVVTKAVGDFHLAVGNPARTVGFVCRCGRPLVRFAPGRSADGEWVCADCSRGYHAAQLVVTEQP